jgi:hypothetical protein
MRNVWRDTPRFGVDPAVRFIGSNERSEAWFERCSEAFRDWKSILTRNTTHTRVNEREHSCSFERKRYTP